MACLVYSNQLHVRVIEVYSWGNSRILQGKKIVQLSDLHIGREGIAHEGEIRGRLAELNPDMILLTGDYVRWFAEKEDYQKAIAFLGTLQAPFGVFAVLGDADYSNARQSCGFCHRADLVRPTPMPHVRFLRNTFVDVPLGQDTLRVIGLDAALEAGTRWQRLQPWVSPRPTILLSHTSVVYRAIPAQEDIFVFSGDTHGGEIYMPDLFWKLWKRKPDPEHMYGHYREGNKQLYVTSGVGSDLPFRFGVPAEIAVFCFH